MIQRMAGGSFPPVAWTCRVVRDTPRGRTGRRSESHASTTMSQWIAAADRLPDDEQTVLVAMVGESESVWLGHHDGDQWWSVDNVRITVTHWMPLPVAPEVCDGD